MNMASEQPEKKEINENVVSATNLTHDVGPYKKKETPKGETKKDDLKKQAPECIIPTTEASNTLLSPELMVKHPLQNKWCLWFFKNDKAKDWAENLKTVTSVDTVEDFWALYNHIQPASKLPSGCDYSLFKEGIEPMWEDDSNKKGGRWLLNLNKQQRHSDLDNFWLEILLCLIGEAFDDCSDDICGAVVNIRNKGDKVALWTSDAKKNDATVKIGKIVKERLNIPQRVTIGFQAHSDTMSKAGSTAKNKFVV